MAWMTDSLITYTPATDALGLIVRPVGAGVSGALNVSVVSGTINQTINVATQTTVVPPTTNPSTASFYIVPQTSSIVQLVPTDLLRAGIQIFNESDSIMRIYHGTNNAVTSSYSFSIGSRLIYESGETAFAGPIYGSWINSGSGNARITSYSAILQVSGVFNVTGSVGQGAPGQQTAPWYVISPDRSTTIVGEQRVAVPYTLLDLVNKYGLDTRLVSTSASLSASVVSNMTASSIHLLTGPFTGSTAKLRSKKSMIYQANRAQRVTMTAFHDDSGVDGQERSWGYYDDDDGLAFMLSGTSFGVLRRSSVTGVVVDTFTSSSQFTHDKCDGTGPDGFKLDLTKGSLFDINFQWLGVGGVNWFIDNKLVHKQTFYNVNSDPFMKTAVLPLSMTVQNIHSSSSSGMSLICANVSSENGSFPPDYTYATGSNQVSTANANEIPLLSVRLRQTYNTIDNRGHIIPVLLNLYVSSTQDAIFRFRLNSTLTGATTWTSPNSYSIAEANVDATGVSDGEDLTGPVYIHGAASEFFDMSDVMPDLEGSRILTRDPWTGDSDVMTVTIQRVDANNVTGAATIIWHEHK